MKRPIDRAPAGSLPNLSWRESGYTALVETAPDVAPNARELTIPDRCVKVLLHDCFAPRREFAIGTHEFRVLAQRPSLCHLLKGNRATRARTMSQQHGMLWVGTGMMPGNSKDSKRDDLNHVASFAALAATTPADASADEVVRGDIETARLFGQRVPKMLARLRLQEDALLAWQRLATAGKKPRWPRGRGARRKIARLVAGAFPKAALFDKAFPFE